MSRVLVVGGSGPTGPFVVNGLIERAHDVTVFHSGAHEVDFDAPVRHIHGDPHFPDTIADALGNETFDIAIVQYGRLRHLADALATKVGHLVAIGSATSILAAPDAPVWGELGRPAIVPEDAIGGPMSPYLEADPARKFGLRIAETYRALFELADRHRFAVTYLAYPILYGPNQPGCREWALVRRMLDGRPHIVLGDGGRKLETRGYAPNVAQAPLLVVDRPEVSAAKSYVVSDGVVSTHRQRAELVANHLGWDGTFVDMPFDLAWPCHPLYRNEGDHRVITSERIRSELGYRDLVSPADALRVTVDWLCSVRPEPGGELEQQLQDPFAYHREDALVARWRQVRTDMSDISSPVAAYAHPYRHPRNRFETTWKAPND